MNNEMIVVMELCDLVDYDKTMSNIAVDKGIFDDFVKKFLYQYSVCRR